MGMRPSRGFIYVATGDGYVELAARSADMARQHNPGIEIDLYTDEERRLPQFDRVHVLENAWHRSKLDGMVATRFDQTIYIDADTLILADIRDVFEVLDRFDIAMAHDQGRNGNWAQTFWRREIPHAFPQFNSGFVAYNTTEEVMKFLRCWSQTVRETNSRQDQNILRELAWLSDLHFGVLPEEYNLMCYPVIERWGDAHAAPRVIHNPGLHRHFTSNVGAKEQKGIGNLRELVGPIAFEKIQDLIRADRSLARREGREAVKPTSRPMRWRRQIQIALRYLIYHLNLSR